MLIIKNVLDEALKEKCVGINPWLLIKQGLILIFELNRVAFVYRTQKLFA